MIDIELAKLNPPTVFKMPIDVVQNKELTQSQKIDILRRWAYDQRELDVAAEENMADNNDNEYGLSDILHALHQLGVGVHGDNESPTKQG